MEKVVSPKHEFFAIIMASRSKAPTTQTNKIEKRLIPKSEIDLRFDKVIRFSTHRRYFDSTVEILPTKEFSESPPKTFETLFLAKCKECAKICDFTSPLSSDVKYRQAKSLILRQIGNAFANPNFLRSITPPTMEIFYQMIAKNLFRTFPIPPPAAIPDLAFSLCDDAWPHVSLSYVALQSSFECRHTAKIPQSFLYKLIRNTVSPDDRERTVARDVLYAIYTKYMDVRDTIRQGIANAFSFGICSAELLQFYGSIVAGFNSPLKSEHLSFYTRYVLPLHSSHSYSSFKTNLVQCITKFISKSNILLEPTFDYIVSHWPCSDRQKEALMISELSELIEGFELLFTASMGEKIFRVVGKCAADHNSDVAETAISLLLNQALSFTLKAYSATIYPLVIPCIYRAAKKHWDECIRSDAYSALNQLTKIDQIAFEKVINEDGGKKEQKETKLQKFTKGWTTVFEMAKQNDRAIEPLELEGFSKRK